MKILRMQATFGCLDEAVLELDGGLNVLRLPNEEGKSTWAAFLLAMFYGIDTTQRAAKGRLPEKLRYQPWNGKPMAGIMEVETEGRILVLQRSSTKTRPMGEFAAYDKETGLAVPELTADNCGMTLLGVERSVFQRTAFLRSSELSVTEEEELSRRLENLAASGDGKENYPAAAAKLKQWKNRLRYHRSGRLPETEEALLQTERALQNLETVRRRRQEAEEGRQQAEQTAASMEQAERACWERAVIQSAAAKDGAVARWEAQQNAQVPSVPQGKDRPVEIFLWAAVALAVSACVLLWLRSLFALLPAVLCTLCVLLFAKNRKERMQAEKEKAAAEAAAQQMAREREQARTVMEQAVMAHEMVSGRFAPSAELAAEKEKAAAFRMEAETLRSREEVLGSWEELSSRRETLTEQRTELLRREQALELAAEALDRGERELAQRYSPQLTRLAGEYLCILTAQRYDGLVLERGFQLQVRQTADGLTRPLGVLSRGTQDQVWLALRLAMTKLLLPEGTPIWLDDVFMSFDDHRTDLALEVLNRQDRQVVVMGCK